MKGLAYSSMRVGKKYTLTNYNEKTEFILIEVLANDEYRLRDIHTLETYLMSDLVQYGRGSDFELREIY